MWGTIFILFLVGMSIAACGIALYFFIRYIHSRQDYEEIENPQPHIYTEQDVSTLWTKYRGLCKEIKALQDEGFSCRDYLNRMKQVSMLVDENAVYLEEEHEIFRSARAAITKLCKQKKEAEMRARYEKAFKEKLCRTQIRILQLLPREIFFSCSRLFLPPSPVNRVGILVNHLATLRGVNQKQIRKGKTEIIRRRRMKPSQMRYYVKEKKERKQKGRKESLDEAKARLRSMADGKKRVQEVHAIRSDKEE